MLALYHKARVHCPSPYPLCAGKPKPGERMKHSAFLSNQPGRRATLKNAALRLLPLMLVLLVAACAPKHSKQTSGEYEPNEEDTQTTTMDPLPYPPADDGTPLTPQEIEALKYQPDFLVPLSGKAEEDVLLQFKFFVRRGNELFAQYLRRSEAYLPFVQKVFAEKGLPADIAYLAIVESGFNPNAVSTSGATGVWQFMPETGKNFGLKRDWWVDERRDPYKSTYAAADYLLKLYGFFNDWSLAIAAYNAGEGKIMKALNGTGGVDDVFALTDKNYMLSGKARLKDETTQYVPKLVAVIRIMHNLRLLGFTPPDYSKGIPLVPVEVSGGVDLLGFSSALGVTWQEFAADNPAFLRTVTPPARSVTVYVPPARKADAMAFLDSPKSRLYAGWKEYKVRKNDSLAKVSKATGVPAEVIAQVNKVRKLKAGQVIILPPTIDRYPREGQERVRDIATAKGTYKVKSGDTLYGIAVANKVPVATLAKANGITEKSTLKVGQKLYIPGKDSSGQKSGSRQVARSGNGGQSAKGESAAGTDKGDSAAGTGKSKTYKVKDGDTVWSIARKAGINPDELLRINKLTGKSVLRPGDTLTLN